MPTTPQPSKSPTAAPTKAPTKAPTLAVTIPSTIDSGPIPQFLYTCTTPGLGCNYVATNPVCNAATQVVAYEYTAPLGGTFQIATFAPSGETSLIEPKCVDTVLYFEKVTNSTGGVQTIDRCNDDANELTKLSLMNIALNPGDMLSFFVGSFKNQCPDGESVEANVELLFFAPTNSPTRPTSFSPTVLPTKVPTTGRPTEPTILPTTSPTKPTRVPTELPTKSPTLGPTVQPTRLPTSSPSTSPTKPTPAPTDIPTRAPDFTNSPSGPTTFKPTKVPTLAPTTWSPSFSPTTTPSAAPTIFVVLPPAPSQVVYPLFKCTLGQQDCTYTTNQEVCHDSTQLVPFVFTSGEPGTYTFTTLNGGTNCADTTLYILETNQCNDDANPSTQRSVIEAVLGAGQTIHLYVGSFRNACPAGNTISLSATLTYKAPTNAPTVPTSKSPTNRPSQLPTVLPTESPTKPTTRSPTRPTTMAPTKSPVVSAPTSSPTLCTPGQVTCCFAAQQRFTQVFVNDVDMTSQLVASPLNSRSFSLTFREPSLDSVIAIKGQETDDILVGSLSVKCVSTRAGSPWTFDSTSVTDWKSVRPTDLVADLFPPGWQSSSFTGATVDATLVTDTSYTSNCTNQTMAASASKLKPFQGAPATAFWSLRKTVKQPVACGSDSPTISTPAPTLVTTSVPTKQPTSAVPTASPTVCTPGIVSCCFSGRQQIRNLYVNNVDITSTIQRVEDLNTTTITKFVSFREPATAAVIAIKGFENNAVFEAVLGMRCQCSRVGSSWNFQSNIYAGWRSVVALSVQNDEFPVGWYTNEFNANGLPFVSAAADSFTLNPAVCGPNVNTTENKVKADQGSPVARFWAMRLMVTQRNGNCGTQGPTVASASVLSEGETGSDGAYLWVIGVVVGCVALVALVAFVVVRRRQQQVPASTTAMSAAAKEEAAATTEDLWLESKDEDTGVKYWVNKKTGEFSWSDPKLKAQQQQQLVSVPVDVESDRS